MGMRIIDIIAKKRDGGILTGDEIAYFVQNYAAGKLPDYQAAAMLMAIYLRGMDVRETTDFTLEMAASGDQIDLSEIPGIKVDKHSTGGVGDKTTLIVAPIVASCGVPVAKMSGRGLGFSGGTIDKLESIAGYRTALSRGEFIDIVKRVGLSITGQTGNLAPADKKLYALRDVTATVESIPLIAASIMSKKLAAGAGAVVLDVKTGSGAFMKTLADAEELARRMVGIGEGAGRETVALITNMDTPLGSAIGNTLEVEEAVQTLCGNGPADLAELCIELAANMLLLAGKDTLEKCRELCRQALTDGSAFKKVLEMVEAHGGDVSLLTNTERLPRAPFTREYRASRDGYIVAMDSQKIGMASVLLGAGRETKDAPVDYTAGIVLCRKTGDLVHEDDTLAVLHTSDGKRMESAMKLFGSAVEISGDAPKKKPFIYKRIDRNSL